jgi:hypothetical protein
MERTKQSRMMVALLLLCAFVLGLSWAPGQARALSLGGGIGDLVKIFGIGWVVDRFASQIDRAINSALAEHRAEIEGATKVVPIIRVGTGGTAVGAAQVMGPQVQVEKVQAVAEIELRMAGTLRARGLIPVSTRDVSSVQSVGGVGVSANIKFPL